MLTLGTGNAILSVPNGYTLPGICLPAVSPVQTIEIPLGECNNVGTILVPQYLAFGMDPEFEIWDYDSYNDQTLYTKYRLIYPESEAWRLRDGKFWIIQNGWEQWSGFCHWWVSPDDKIAPHVEGYWRWEIFTVYNNLLWSGVCGTNVTYLPWHWPASPADPIAQIRTDGYIENLNAWVHCNPENISEPCAVNQSVNYPGDLAWESVATSHDIGNTEQAVSVPFHYNPYPDWDEWYSTADGLICPADGPDPGIEEKGHDYMNYDRFPMNETSYIWEDHRASGYPNPWQNISGSQKWGDDPNAWPELMRGICFTVLAEDKMFDGRNLPV